MKDVIAPAPLEQILAELTPDKLMRRTNKGGNEIYILTHKDSPVLMQEIGRLRELTFRDAGGGTGEEMDLDPYDLAEVPYKQLIVWDPDAREILGGYRYMVCSEAPRDEKGKIMLATSELFRFSERFCKEYIPYTLELGRSFVTPEYQSSKAGAKALYALDNLWDGLGALTVDHPGIRYFFGKVTMYDHFHTEARNLIQYFFLKYFRDRENLVFPIKPFDFNIDYPRMEALFQGADYKEDYKILTQTVRQFGENIPPLFNAYMNLSPSMKTFGTVRHEGFGNVLETGIILTVDDIYAVKKDRHIETHIRGKETESWLLPE
ncbi:MAG TPA: GNAT family N-acetyltransferase, partial [Prolixibacteraceae bacterium]|nr:GNAT family N-acetyltransferase [Prolixibacteraceae bacterium]